VNGAVGGTTAPRLAAVRQAFADNVTTGEETGAAFAVAREGATLVDLWAGFADAARARPWRKAAMPGANGHATALGLARVLAARDDSDRRGGVAYLMNRMLAAPKPQARARCLLDALYGALG
jgi:hypothetical protein